MSNGFVNSNAAMVGPLVLLMASCAGDGEGKKETENPARYPSPTAVFDAYRNALGKREWRTVFSLLTTEAQNETVFETFFSCAELDSDESNAIIKRYVDLTAANDEYESQYKAKHGVDLKKLMKEHQDDPEFVPPAQDREIFRDAVAEHVKDKPGFYESAAKMFVETTPVFPLGDLEHLVVKGDTAKGSAVQTIVSRSGESSSQGPGQSQPVYEKSFEFRRVGNGWLLDSL
jgi:hypothetical protein